MPDVDKDFLSTVTDKYKFKYFPRGLNKLIRIDSYIFFLYLFLNCALNCITSYYKQRVAFKTKKKKTNIVNVIKKFNCMYNVHTLRKNN